jgi:hypothetical protein
MTSLYEVYCGGERWAKGLIGTVHLNCETPGRSWSISCNFGRFLASCDISLLNWLMLIFFCHLGVNSCCYSWYIWHMPYLRSMGIPILTCQQPKRWRTRLAGTRSVSYNYIKVQTIKLHCCNKYFKLYAGELLFTWAFVYSIHLIEIAIGIVIDWSSIQLNKLLIQKQLYDFLIISLLPCYTKQLIASYYSPCNTEWHIRNTRTVNLPCMSLNIYKNYYYLPMAFNSTLRQKTRFYTQSIWRYGNFFIKFHVCPPWQYTRTARRSPARTLPNIPFARRLPTWILLVL